MIYKMLNYNIDYSKISLVYFISYELNLWYVFSLRLSYNDMSPWSYSGFFQKPDIKRMHSLHNDSYFFY